MVEKTTKRRSILRRGLMALLPALITIFIISLLFNFFNSNIAKPLGTFVLTLIGWFSSWDTTSVKQNVWVVSIIGFPLSIILIFFLSYLMATFLGRWLLKELDILILSKFPVIKSIYPYAKQFSDLFSSDNKKAAFQKVVAVEYPRPGLYSFAFLTSEGLKEMDKKIGKDMVSIFLPNTPTPFTGWTAFIPRDEIIPLSITVDEAIRLLVSGGVLIPPNQLKELQKPKTSNETK
jgi:uncharacterized membrane protein